MGSFVSNSLWTSPEICTQSCGTVSRYLCLSKFPNQVYLVVAGMMIYDANKMFKSNLYSYRWIWCISIWMINVLIPKLMQLVNHGIPEELLERVKKVCSECYKLEREESFKNSKKVKMLNDLVEKKSGHKLENVDWEDVFLLSDENEWPSKTPGFK